MAPQIVVVPEVAFMKMTDEDFRIMLLLKSLEDSGKIADFRIAALPDRGGSVFHNLVLFPIYPGSNIHQNVLRRLTGELFFDFAHVTIRIIRQRVQGDTD